MMIFPGQLLGFPYDRDHVIANSKTSLTRYQVEMHEILLNIESKEVRYAHLKNGQLYDLVVEQNDNSRAIFTEDTLQISSHNIQSAFIDIQKEKMDLFTSPILSKPEKI